MLPGNAQVRVVLVLSVTVIVALSTVVNMMQGDFTNLFIGLGVAGIALYVGGLWKQSWAAAIMVGLAGFSIAPTSFWIPSDFMCCGLALGMAATLLMRRALGAPGLETTVTPGLSLYAVLVFQLLYVAYLGLQGMAGEVSPVYVGQYSLKNTIKGYAEDMLPVVTFVALVIMRYRLPTIAVLVKWVTPCAFAVVFLLVSYRLYQISQGHYEGDDTTQYFGVLIPGINLIPGEFALRSACPIAGMWAAAILFSSSVKLSKIGLFLNVALLGVSLFGAVISSGRAVPILVLMSILAMAFLFRDPLESTCRHASLSIL